jgi:hypothetical protein
VLLEIYMRRKLPVTNVKQLRTIDKMCVEYFNELLENRKIKEN